LSVNLIIFFIRIQRCSDRTEHKPHLTGYIVHNQINHDGDGLIIINAKQKAEIQNGKAGDDMDN